MSATCAGNSPRSLHAFVAPPGLLNSKGQLSGRAHAAASVMFNSRGVGLTDRRFARSRGAVVRRKGSSRAGGPDKQDKAHFWETAQGGNLST
jgi:hypothetical protein